MLTLEKNSLLFLRHNQLVPKALWARNTNALISGTLCGAPVAVLPEPGSFERLTITPNGYCQRNRGEQLHSKMAAISVSPMVHLRSCMPI